MSQPLISIIITVLNGGQTIDQCLASIEQQSFTDYEVVIVDGGSTDNTLELIEASKVESRRLKVVPGIGLYAGLNEGIRLARGQWFYFIGCDDELYSPETLQQVADAIANRKHNARVLVGDVFYKNSGFIYRTKLGTPYLMGYQVHHQGMFYERSIFDSMHYDETLRIASDYEVNLKLVLSGVVHQHIDLLVCRFDNEGISHRELERGAKEMQQVHRRVFKGIGRQWITTYFSVRYHVGLFRERFHLVDLKVKFKRFISNGMLGFPVTL